MAFRRMGDEKMTFTNRKDTDRLNKELMAEADIDSYIKKNEFFLLNATSQICWRSCMSSRIFQRQSLPGVPG